MAYLKAFLALFSFAGKFAWLAPFSKLLAFVPGFQVPALVAGALSWIGTVLGWILALFKWLVVDVTDAFKEPQRLVVRTVCVLAALAFGVHQGIRWDAHLVDAKQTTINQMIEDGRKADAANLAKFDKALAAAVAAQLAEREKAKAETAAAAGGAAGQPKRVRAKSPGKGLSQIGGPSLQGFQKIFGGS